MTDMKSDAAPASIVTERTTLRAFRESDAPFVQALLNDPDWIRNIGDRGVRTLDHAASAIRDKYIAAYARDGVGLMLVERNADGVPMGMCGLIRRPGLDDVDIGFAFLPAFRGAGYAFETAQAVLNDGRERGFARIVAITLPTNRPSISLLERLGLRFDKAVRLAEDKEELSLYAITLKGATV